MEKHRVKIVLWTSALDVPEDPSGDSLVPLRTYIRNHYRVAENLPDFEVWVGVGPQGLTFPQGPFTIMTLS